MPGVGRGESEVDGIHRDVRPDPVSNHGEDLTVG